MADDFTQSQQSTSTTTSTRDPLLDALAQINANIGQQLYNWAGQQFASNSAVTDQTVNNFFQASQSARDMAGKIANRYQNVYQPLEDRWLRQAALNLSPEEQQFRMGRVESDTAQAMDANRLDAEQRLRDYGINPSEGAFRGLETASATARGAAQAGAAQLERDRMRQEGRQMELEGLKIGEQYPANFANISNVDLQALQGAINAKLANANTGVNMFGAGQGYLGNAMRLPNNQNSRTDSSGGSRGSRGGSQQQPRSPSESGAGGREAPTGGGSSGWDPMTHGGAGRYDTGGGGGGGFNPFGSTPRIIGGQALQDSLKMRDELLPPQRPPTYGPEWQDFGQGPGMDNTFDPLQSVNDYDLNQWNQGFQNVGQNYYDNNTQGDYTFDPSQENLTSNQGFDEAGFAPSDYYDPGSGYDYGGGGDYGGYDRGGGVLRYDAGGDEALADAAEQGDATSGGFVPQQASPSMGHNVDDIPANLNAEEFVVPRDVARWKGEEFFHKLIAQARKNRMSAQSQVGGKPAAPAPGPVRFASRSTGGVI